MVHGLPVGPGFNSMSPAKSRMVMIRLLLSQPAFLLGMSKFQFFFFPNFDILMYISTYLGVCVSGVENVVGGISCLWGFVV